MEVVAYFSHDLPPPHNATERYVRDLLAEYRDASNGKIRVTIVHPTKDEQKQAAERDGITRVQDRNSSPTASACRKASAAFRFTTWATPRRFRASTRWR